MVYGSYTLMCKGITPTHLCTTTARSHGCHCQPEIPQVWCILPCMYVERETQFVSSLLSTQIAKYICWLPEWCIMGYKSTLKCGYFHSHDALDLFLFLHTIHQFGDQQDTFCYW